MPRLKKQRFVQGLIGTSTHGGKSKEGWWLFRIPGIHLSEMETLCESSTCTVLDELKLGSPGIATGVACCPQVAYN
jgi:hypothetical protein